MTPKKKRPERALTLTQLDALFYFVLCERRNRGVDQMPLQGDQRVTNAHSFNSRRCVIEFN